MFYAISMGAIGQGFKGGLQGLSKATLPAVEESAARNLPAWFKAGAEVIESPYWQQNAVKGAMGEAAATPAMKHVGYQALECRLPGTKGIDHIYIKYDTNGAVGEVVVAQDVVVIESKYNSGGKLQLAKSGAEGEKVQQLSNVWMSRQMDFLKDHHPETHSILIANEGKIRFKANVRDPSGRNKWYDYGGYNPKGEETIAIRTLKPKGGK